MFFFAVSKGEGEEEGKKKKKTVKTTHKKRKCSFNLDEFA
jgi:hypothetical protein